MIPLLCFIACAHEEQQRFNKRIQLLMRAVNKMGFAEVWKHRKHKHFRDLVYFWVANDYAKKIGE